MDSGAHNGVRRCDYIRPGSKKTLTGREQEILRLVSRGHRNRDIARLVTTTERNVEFHVTNLLRKLGARSRTELVYVARMQGWLTD